MSKNENNGNKQRLTDEDNAYRVQAGRAVFANYLASWGRSAAKKDVEEILVDLLTDLQYYCKTRSIDFASAHDSSLRHFDAERRFPVLDISREILEMVGVPNEKCASLTDDDMQALADSVGDLLCDRDGPFWDAVKEAAENL